MSGQIAVTCFTDVQGSTRLTEELGDQFEVYRSEHLRVGRWLAEKNATDIDEHYIKSIGDAHMVKFTSLVHALEFALHLQEYHENRPCINRQELNIRIGMYLGSIQSQLGDIFGSGVNRAARVEHCALPGEVRVNREFVNALKEMWPVGTAEKYFRSVGEIELKGVAQPQEVFVFDWRLYRQDRPKKSLAHVVHGHLKSARVSLQNIDIGYLAVPGTIVWPVVPRDLATAIHRGQLEIAKLLCLLGWNVHVLITDCGRPQHIAREYTLRFQEAIERHAAFRGLKGLRFTLMSALYEPTHPEYDRIQRWFRTVAEHFRLEDLIRIKEKDLPKRVKDNIPQASTLNFLVPALTAAAVLSIADDHGVGRYIVLAGADEEYQWTRTLSVEGQDKRGARDYIGLVLNPILQKTDGGRPYQEQHKQEWPIWYGVDKILDSMESSNLAHWLFSLHAFLPAFPASRIALGGAEIGPGDWSGTFEIPDKLRAVDLAEYVWGILDPRASPPAKT